MHTIGWPLDRRTYGGSFLYHLEDNQVAVGFVDRARLPAIPICRRSRSSSASRPIPRSAPTFEGGRRIAYGARAINEGGLQAIPKLVFPGGALIGCAAGFVNVPKIKGSHTAMKSGMLAAEAVFEALSAGGGASSTAYPAALEASWVRDELYQVRNIRPGFRLGLCGGLVYAALDTYLLRGKAPWTLHHHPDHSQLKPARELRPDRLSEARRHAHLRPAVLGLPLEHQPRGEPAAAT